VAYWVRQRNAGDMTPGALYATDRAERVPAEQMLHLKLTTRWPQTRGEPWSSAAMRKLDDVNGVANTRSAPRAPGGVLRDHQDPEERNPLADDTDDTGQPMMAADRVAHHPGTAPATELAFHAPEPPEHAPSSAFMRAMLRESRRAASAPATRA